MATTRNRLTYAVTGKVNIPFREGGIRNLETALSFNKELSRYGFSLSLDAIFRLATNDKETIANTAKEIEEILDDDIGISDFASSRPFYPDFPEQVMSAEEGELYLNAMIYYMFAQTDNKEMTEIANMLRENMVGEATITRRPLAKDLIRDELKVLSPAGEKELEEQFKIMIMGPNLSESQFRYLKEYAADDSRWRVNIFGLDPLDIPSHETLTKLALMCHEQNRRNDLMALLTKSEDILRFAAVLSASNDYRSKHMDANLSFMAKDARFSLTRSQQTLIKSLLERSNDLYFSIWQREDMWKKLMPRLNTRDDRFPRVKEAFDNLHNKNRVLESGRTVRRSADSVLDGITQKLKEAGEKFEKAIGEKSNHLYISALDYRADIDEIDLLIDNYAQTYPSHFARNIMRLAKEGVTVDVLCPLIEKNLGDVPVFQLLKTANFAERSGEWDYRIATNKAGKSVVLENDKDAVDTETRQEIAAALREKAQAALSYDMPYQKVYIDESLADRKLQQRDSRDASEGAVLTKFSEINGKEDKNIVAFGIYWKNKGDERADIDLSASVYGEDGRRLGEVYYGLLRDTWGVHSGDYTSGVISPEINGAEEFLFIDKQILKDMGAKYIIPYVHGFNRPFSEAESVRFMFMEKSGSLDMVTPYDAHGQNRHAPMFDGRIVEPSEIELSYRLTQNDNMATPFIYDVEQDKFVWIDSTREIRGIPNVQNGMGISQTAIDFYRAFHNDYPDMYELAMLYAAANNIEIVQNPQEADIIFSAEPIDRAARGISETVRIIEANNINQVMDRSNETAIAAELEQARLAREAEMMAELAKDDAKKREQDRVRKLDDMEDILDSRRDHKEYAQDERASVIGSFIGASAAIGGLEVGASLLKGEGELLDGLDTIGDGLNKGDIGVDKLGDLVRGGN